MDKRGKFHRDWHSLTGAAAWRFIYFFIWNGIEMLEHIQRRNRDGEGWNTNL